MPLASLRKLRRGAFQKELLSLVGRKNQHVVRRRLRASIRRLADRLEERVGIGKIDDTRNFHAYRRKARALDGDRSARRYMEVGRRLLSDEDPTRIARKHPHFRREILKVVFIDGHDLTGTRTLRRLPRPCLEPGRVQIADPVNRLDGIRLRYLLPDVIDLCTGFGLDLPVERNNRNGLARHGNLGRRQKARKRQDKGDRQGNPNGCGHDLCETAQYLASKPQPQDHGSSSQVRDP